MDRFTSIHSYRLHHAEKVHFQMFSGHVVDEPVASWVNAQNETSEPSDEHTVNYLNNDDMTVYAPKVANIIQRQRQSVYTRTHIPDTLCKRSATNKQSTQTVHTFAPITHM